MSSKKRILVVDDEPNIREVVELYLRRDGYEVEVVGDGAAALAAVERKRPDLIVLDLMLPILGGIQVTRALRQGDERDIPIIMLTAKGEEADRIAGLELGADDYLTKPFSPKELVARVKAVLRRASDKPLVDPQAHPLRSGEITLNPSTRQVWVGQEETVLTAKEFDLLWFLMNHPGQVFTRDQLLDRVWGFDFFGDASTVTVHVRRLREKVERDSTRPEYVLTVWGVGYKFRLND
ncbi:MAG: DNA-binding response regulator [Anaerolineae bacterium]|nr:response regulator transcription factor [Anaerolineales bacterium]MCQ3980732.1 DNA-binding response regulator [Anaerolineae bacterium]